jgi:ATP-dependent 26S proteasome regulatory subunit
MRKQVDGILRARGDSSEHEASRRVRNELMAAWDGLQSRETERILVLATTNRPFDLDDAVVRRLPRRLVAGFVVNLNQSLIVLKFKILKFQLDFITGSLSTSQTCKIGTKFYGFFLPKKN